MPWDWPVLAEVGVVGMQEHDDESGAQGFEPVLRGRLGDAPILGSHSIWTIPK